jgi:carboxylesterase type B
MNGECRDEHALYATWRPLVTPTFDAVKMRLCADYPVEVVSRLLTFYCGPDKALPPGMRDWKEVFGKLYANMQVHSLERGFHEALERGGLEYGKDVLRYRFDWRTDGGGLPKEWGVTHATDMDIWFYGMESKDGLTEEEKVLLKPWNEAFARFVKGDGMEGHWGTKGVKEMLRLRQDGGTDIWIDDRWEEGVECWKAVNTTRGGLWSWVRSRL